MACKTSKLDFSQNQSATKHGEGIENTEDVTSLLKKLLFSNVYKTTFHC